MKNIKENLAIGGITAIIVIGIVVLVYALSTVFFYYAVNFVLNVFNFGAQITWAQALGITIIAQILKSIFGSTKEAK